MTWREAYLHQAASDYSIYMDMNRRNDPLCHRLHYLQMASEKLAKSFLCSSTGNPYKKTHFAFVRFLQNTKRIPAFQRQLRKESYAYRAYIDNILDLAQRVESLAPVGGNYDKMNTEYPWADGTGMIRTPCDYSFSEFSTRDLLKMQTLMTDLLRIASNVSIEQ